MFLELFFVFLEQTVESNILSCKALTILKLLGRAVIKPHGKNTTSILSANILLFELNNAHMTNLFQGAVFRMLPERTGRKYVHLKTDENIFRIVDRSTLWVTPYLNVVIGILKLPFMSYMYSCQLLTSAPTSESISQSVSNAVKLFGTNCNSFGFFFV